MTDISIKASTPIEDLRDAGIVPDWMAKDCEEHGMYEAENILCEWDWEYDWDLGDGYDAHQLEVLDRVRSIIHAALGY